MPKLTSHPTLPGETRTEERGIKEKKQTREKRRTHEPGAPPPPPSFSRLPQSNLVHYFFAKLSRNSMSVIHLRGSGQGARRSRRRCHSTLKSCSGGERLDSWKCPKWRRRQRRRPPGHSTAEATAITAGRTAMGGGQQEPRRAFRTGRERESELANFVGAG